MKMPAGLNRLKEAGLKWNEDNSLRLAAALAYYTLFSLGPLLLLATAIAGFFLGEEAVRGQLEAQLVSLMGRESAAAVQSIIVHSRKESSGIFATVVSVIALVLGAAGVFGELQSALNKIWKTEPKKTTGVWGFVRNKLLTFAMILAIGFILLVSLLFSAALSAISEFMSGVLPLPGWVLQISEFVFSFALITLLFGLIIKILPNAPVGWRDVWSGAALASLFFSIGKMGIGVYVAKSGITSPFGASGSIIVILVWTYYSSLILFFGAEFAYVTQEVRKRKRLKAVPSLPHRAV